MKKYIIHNLKIIILIANAIILLTVGIVICNSTEDTISKYSSYDTYYREMELKYWSTKYAIVETIESYMNSCAPNHNLSALELLNACDIYNIDVRLPLVQGYVESHFGTKGLALKTNQVWNVGAFDGLSADEIHPQHKFKHPNESIDPYLRLLKDRYLGDTKTEQQLLRKFTDLSGNRYATSVLYEKELQGQWIKVNKATGLDTLLAQYKYLKTELER